MVGYVGVSYGLFVKYESFVCYGYLILDRVYSVFQDQNRVFITHMLIQEAKRIIHEIYVWLARMISQYFINFVKIEIDLTRKHYCRIRTICFSGSAGVCPPPPPRGRPP